MATLLASKIKDTYKSLLKMATSGNNGIDGTFISVEDGDATASTLQLSTAGVKSTGTLDVTGVTTLAATTIAGAITATSQTLAVGAITSSGALALGSNTITSGLINGQTISSSANFTGTLGVAGLNLSVGTLTPVNAAANRGTLTINGGASASAILTLSTGGVAQSSIYVNEGETNIQREGNFPMQFYTNSTLRMAISGAGAVTIAGTLGVTGILTMPSLLSGYQWGNWSPTDLIGSSTNAPSTGTTDDSSYSTSVNSSGTVTITFVTAGKYLINMSGSSSHADVYTFDRITFTLGGTATKRWSSNTNTVSGDSVNDLDLFSTLSFYLSATASQTLTILPVYELSGGGTVGSHAARASVTALFCGV